MTCAESLCCGTPVAGFMNGGSESVALQKYSHFVEYGDMAALKRIVEKTKKKNPRMSYEIGEEAKSRYSVKRMSDRYLDVYRELATAGDNT